MRRNERQSMMVRVRTACSESGGGGFESPAEGSVVVVDVGVVGSGSGVVGAERARS